MMTRKEFLFKGSIGLGSVALASLLKISGSAQANDAFSTASPLAPKLSHFKPTAKSVIFLFMEGGPSQMDTFDPKPAMNQLAGQKVPSSFNVPITAMGEVDSPILPSKRQWKQHGQSGIWVSDWLPHIAECVDDIAVIRSCWTNGINHAGGVCQMNTGTPLAGRPSLGSWVSYGLGSENQNLPAFVVMQDNKSQVVNGPRNWGTGFLPAVYQGSPFKTEGAPIPNLFPEHSLDSTAQQRQSKFLNQLNQSHASQRHSNSELAARIESYELAYRMQSHAPEAVDLSGESEAVQRLYGMDDKETATFGRQCLLARRLVERGVRFVQLYHGAGSKWDAHAGIESNHTRMCRSSDKPVAGLLKDLKSRGLLDETLVIWGGEFGRTPMSEKGDGRDHNPTGFTMWMAGGGIQGGQVIGATDEIGLHAVEDRMHVHDLHATILGLLGIHNLDLIYHYKGRPETPTINEGEFNRKLMKA